VDSIFLPVHLDLQHPKHLSGDSLDEDLVICSLLMFSLELSPSATAATDPAVIRDFDRPSPAAKRRRGSNQQGVWEVACLFFSWRSVWEMK
jgi:hypothetical protein